MLVMRFNIVSTNKVYSFFPLGISQDNVGGIKKVVLFCTDLIMRKEETLFQWRSKFIIDT